MNIKLLSVAVGIALSATVMSANAQKSYTSGTITISMSMMGNKIEAKEYFTADSGAVALSTGPITLRMLYNTKHSYYAQLVDVPVANKKMAAVYTPDEVDQQISAYPAFTFAPGTETKQISGFSCKKVVATDPKTKKTYDIWITNDVSVPAGVVSTYYATIGGFPVQYTSFYLSPNGQLIAGEVTVTGISDQKAPAGTFAIGADFDKISKDDMDAMARQGGGR